MPSNLIKVVDRIKYLPKSRSSEMIKQNDILNSAYKSLVEQVKQKLKRINTKGNPATVTISGRVSKTSRSTNIEVSTNCDDAELLQTIQKALK